jgi:hypothetical protein
MGLVESIIGGIFGGGASASSVEYGVTSTVQGGERPIGLVSTIQGGDRPVTADVGLDDVNVDIGGTGKPLHSVGELRTPDTLRTAADVAFAVTRPIVSEIDGTLDVEPIQVDLCVNVGLTKLPRARIEQPYASRFDVTLFGTEIVGLRWSGRSDVVIDELDQRPHVELGGDHTREHDQQRSAAAIDPGDGDGLHVRLG